MVFEAIDMARISVLYLNPTGAKCSLFWKKDTIELDFNKTLLWTVSHVMKKEE